MRRIFSNNRGCMAGGHIIVQYGALTFDTKYRSVGSRDLAYDINQNNAALHAMTGVPTGQFPEFRQRMSERFENDKFKRAAMVMVEVSEDTVFDFVNHCLVWFGAVCVALMACGRKRDPERPTNGPNDNKPWTGARKIDRFVRASAAFSPSGLPPVAILYFHWDCGDTSWCAFGVLVTLILSYNLVRLPRFPHAESTTASRGV